MRSIPRAGDEYTSLKLVASNDDRASVIRDHLLLRVRRGGVLKVQRDLVRTISFEQPPWVVHHWPPFNDLHPGEASSPGYRHAVERQRASLDSRMIAMFKPPPVCCRCAAPNRTRRHPTGTTRLDGRSRCRIGTDRHASPRDGGGVRAPHLSLSVRRCPIRTVAT